MTARTFDDDSNLRSVFAGRRCLPFCILLAAYAGLAGCPSSGPGEFIVGIDPGVVGLTTGGQEDVADARAQINAGYIPDPDSITVEGFMSEHDIPIAPPENPGTFYASFAVAYRQPFGEPAPMGDLFVGVGTTIDLDSFRRPALNLAVVVDRSTSMDWSTSDADSRRRLDAVKEALGALVNQLTENDVFTLVSFNTLSTIDVPPTRVAAKEPLRVAIDRLKAEGDTNIYDALRRGFEQVLTQQSRSRSGRVILFTDAQPNVGPGGSPSFVRLIEEFADQGIGFTLMGVGTDFGDELARDISYVRGANSFFLADSDRIATVFDDDFDFLVTPAAYDLELEVRIPDGVGIRDVYGVPDYVPGTNGAKISVPTLFFSRREGGGAIVVRLTSALTPPLTDDEIPVFAEDVVFGTAKLAYTLTDGTREVSRTPLILPAGLSPTAEPPYYSQDSAKRAALLLDTALVLKNATRAADSGRRSDAAAQIREFLGYFDQASIGMSDRTDPSSRGLSDERELLESLMGAVQSGYYYNDYYYGY